MLCICFRQYLPKRNNDSQLLPSYLVAHHAVCLMLLRSSSDMVRSARLHKTLVSTSLIEGRPSINKA